MLFFIIPFNVFSEYHDFCYIYDKYYLLLIDNDINMSLTTRNEGGFGSTGGMVNDS